MTMTGRQLTRSAPRSCTRHVAEGSHLNMNKSYVSERTDHPLSRINVEVTAKVTFTTSPQVRQAKRLRSALPKETKTKQFKIFLTSNPDAYVLLLQTILDKYGKENYRVAAKRPYLFKYYLKRRAYV